MSNTEDELCDLIKNNFYITNCKSNKKKDPTSLSSLIDKQLSHSDCIKLGNGVEKLFVDLILKKTKLKNIKPKNIKGKKEKDHLFLQEDDKIIYYSELKANINLDTEKSKSTYDKCISIINELKKEYPDHTIKWCLLGYRYLEYKDIPDVIKKKYGKIKDNLFGVNQYLTMLNIDLQFTYETYKIFLNKIVDQMFD